MPFLTIFLLFVMMFTLIIVIMQADFSDEDYPGLSKILRILISTFRLSVGDIQITNYGKWDENSDISSK